MSKAGMKLMTPGQISRMPKNDCILFLKGERPIYDKKNWSFNTEVFKEAEKIAGQNGYKNPVYVSYDERNKKYITTRFESRLNYISKEEFTFFEEKAKEDSSIQTFQIDEEERTRIDLLPEVTDKRWLPAFFHALYLLSMFCNLGYDMNVMEILITNSNSFYIMKI